MLTFVVLEAAAMALYPGGTFWDAHASGHRFWQNFLCDLEWRVALDGQDNRVGALLAQGAMLALVAAFLPFWVLAGSGRALRALGSAAVVAMAAVALMPSERFGALHGVAVLIAGPTGLGAAVLAVRAHLRANRRALAGLGAATLSLGAVDLGLYAWNFGTGGPGPLALPAIQKLALILLLAWMVGVGSWPGEPHGVGPRSSGKSDGS